jgi:hypothetical protein
MRDLRQGTHHPIANRNFCMLFLRSAHTKNRTEIWPNLASDKSHELRRNRCQKITIYNGHKLKSCQEMNAASKMAQFVFVRYSPLACLNATRITRYMPRNVFPFLSLNWNMARPPEPQLRRYWFSRHLSPRPENARIPYGGKRGRVPGVTQ